MSRLGIKGSSTGGGITSESETKFTAENKDASDVDPGMAVKIHSSGVGVELALADSVGNRAAALCIATAAITNGNSGPFRTDGVVDLSDWTDATGSATLSAFAVYYLDQSNNGMLTTTAPTTVGQIVQRIGTAISSTKLYLEIEQPILL